MRGGAKHVCEGLREHSPKALTAEPAQQSDTCVACASSNAPSPCLPRCLQLQTNFLNDFATKRTGARDKDYAIDSTTYFFAEFLAWLEVIRGQVVFVTG